MEVQVIGEDITPEEVTAEMGWRTARSRRPDKKPGQNSSHDDPPQSQDSRSRSKTRKNVKSQVLKAGRMPQLPKNEIKIIVRPKGALNIPKVGSPTVTAAIFQATQLSPEESQDDTICPNVQQNIVVISTPRPHNADRYVRMKSIHVNGVTHEVNAYEAAPDNTTKGVIRGIPLTDSAQEIEANIINARNPLALAAKRIGSTTTIVIAFDGPSVPHLVRYGATLIPCCLYRKQIDICYHCGRLGHRMDVCPFPNNKICRGCGARNPEQDHQCTPKCTLCGGPHPTADKGCTAKYKTPYVIRKRLWEERKAQQSLPQPEQAVPGQDLGRPQESDKLRKSDCRHHSHGRTTNNSSRDQARSQTNNNSSPKQRQRFGPLLRKTLDIAKRNTVVVVGDFNAPHPAWGYRRGSVKGRSLWADAQHVGLTLVTDPQQPTRTGNSAAPTIDGRKIQDREHWEALLLSSDPQDQVWATRLAEEAAEVQEISAVF
ncbi:hypothetical protein ISCGN_000985 [Ixodes scapularis]